MLAAGPTGWAVAYEPAAQVTHVQGVSADRHPYRMLFAHHVSMWRFAWRTTYGRRRWVLPLVLVGLGSAGHDDGRRPWRPSWRPGSPDGRRPPRGGPRQVRTAR